MDTSPRTYRFVPADIYTSGYRIVGKVMVTTNGVMGIMNDITKSHAEIHDARLARLHMPTKLVDHFDVVRLVKAHVYVVCVVRREDLGPTAVIRGGYTATTEYPARITTQVYELEGKLEFPGRFDFTALISEGTRNFIPLFNATMTAILIPNLKVDSAGMLFNRLQVDSLALLGQRAKPEK